MLFSTIYEKSFPLSVGLRYAVIRVGRYNLLSLGGPMKKIDDMMSQFDQQVEKQIKPIWPFVQKYFSFFSAGLLIGLLVIFLLRVFSDRSYILVASVKEDIRRLEQVLQAVDADCNILSIQGDRAIIDFLTVEKFTGSMVGPLNLAYPGKWQGPYLSQNPTIQQKFYEIVCGKDGYVLIPGHGVVLPNGLVIGKDIVITPQTLVNPMLAQGGRLNYKGQMLGMFLKFKIGDWDTPRPNKETIEHINEVLQEFNEAMPYAKRFDDLPYFSVVA